MIWFESLVLYLRHKWMVYNQYVIIFSARWMAYHFAFATNPFYFITNQHTNQINRRIETEIEIEEGRKRVSRANMWTLLTTSRPFSVFVVDVVVEEWMYFIFCFLWMYRLSYHNFILACAYIYHTLAVSDVPYPLNWCSENMDYFKCMCECGVFMNTHINETSLRWQTNGIIIRTRFVFHYHDSSFCSTEKVFFLLVLMW